MLAYHHLRERLRRDYNRVSRKIFFEVKNMVLFGSIRQKVLDQLDFLLNLLL
jgi:hypothetical protein